jgi:hypothetical protein
MSLFDCDYLVYIGGADLEKKFFMLFRPGADFPRTFVVLKKQEQDCLPTPQEFTVRQVSALVLGRQPRNSHFD